MALIGLIEVTCMPWDIDRTKILLRFIEGQSFFSNLVARRMIASRVSSNGDNCQYIYGVPKHINK